MKASEQLRAIEPVQFTVKAGSIDPYVVGTKTFYEVPLPLIADCIEAAEGVDQRHRTDEYLKLFVALTTLRDALEEK